MRYSLIFILLICLTAVASAETAGLDVDSPNIEKAIASSPENVSANITLVNESQQIELENFGVIEAFNLDMPYYENVEFMFTVNRDYAQEYIDNNPGLYNGPGHNFDSGLISLIREEKRELINVRNVNGTLKSTLTREGTYYLVITPTSEPPQTYINEDGECVQLVEEPGDNYEKVDSCDQRNWKLIGVSIVLLGILALASFLGYRKIKEKYLIRKLNSLTNEIEESGSVNQEILEELYEAMEDVREGKYKQASNLIDRIEKEEN